MRRGRRLRGVRILLRVPERDHEHIAAVCRSQEQSLLKPFEVPKIRQDAVAEERDALLGRSARRADGRHACEHRAFLRGGGVRETF
jgi:hypothetical protein